MKAVSAHTVELDPYRAGVELADALKPLEPEAVLLFPTIYYGSSSELTEAILDVLEDDRVVLIGGTGDGFFEASRTADVGAAAIGFNSHGKVRWRGASATGASAAPRDAAERCLRQLTEQMPGGPDLIILLSDFRADGTALEEAIDRTVRCPVVGGLAGDDNLKMNACFTYHGRDVLADGVVALGLQGDFRYDIHVAHDLQPVGRTGVVTAADRTGLHTIDGRPAMDFIEGEIGRPVTSVDQGIVTINVLDRSTPEKRYLRSIVPPADPAQRGLSLFGGVAPGTRVQVCIAQPEDIIAEVHRIGDSVRSTGFEPAAGVLISCAGRKHLLGNRIEHEASVVVGAMPRSFALAGIPSFGELGPVKVEGGYSETLFHNMTYVLLLLGA